MALEDVGRDELVVVVVARVMDHSRALHAGGGCASVAGGNLCSVRLVLSAMCMAAFLMHLAVLLLHAETADAPRSAAAGGVADGRER